TSDESAHLQSRRTIAFVGNPNVGKTTLFNRIAGIRAKTSNFPGTTQEARVAHLENSTLIDLPGVYSLDLDVSESRVCREVLAGALAPAGEHAHVPDAILIVLDSTNLLRNLSIAAEAISRRLPTVVALNMSDLAARRSIQIDTAQLADCLGCTVIACSAHTGQGVQQVTEALAKATIPTRSVPTTDTELDRWVDEIYATVATAGTNANDRFERFTDRLDHAFTHPILGIALFTLIMTGLFWVIFRFAAIPMDMIDGLFGSLGDWVASVMPEGALSDLLVNGIIAGVGGTVIFLPQICLLFFLIALLEATGYLARAAFVIDRLLRPFGLSGHAFVPLLSSHACAIPGIMAARAVPDPRDRIATIMAAPFMSCTARIPVYVLLTQILFPNKPAMQAVAFTACYVIGALAGLGTSMLIRRTILRGKSRPMALELPSYRIPDFKAAFRLMLDRAMVFLKKAGTLIVAISIILWWLGAYPGSAPTQQAQDLRTQATFSSSSTEINDLYAQADALDARNNSANSFLGKIGSTVQPIFEPLGYDRQLTIGVLASFAAREVFVSTMAVQVVGSDDVDDDSVLASIANAKRDDGTPIFTAATSWSLLVFYILASLCLPTLVVTAKETGGWKWALLQLGWMSFVAYIGAFAAFQIVTMVGG
ncbi:MAG: ferrous iron transporter B, partial [Phycisphaerales bacterium]|nr:ferrous iron transporter B [Phycisphaerales bacterium]